MPTLLSWSPAHTSFRANTPVPVLLPLMFLALT